MRYLLWALIFLSVTSVAYAKNPLAGRWVNPGGVVFIIPDNLQNPFQILRIDPKSGKQSSQDAQWISLGKSFKTLWSKDDAAHKRVCTVSDSDPNTIDVTRDGKPAEHWMRQK